MPIDTAENLRRKIQLTSGRGHFAMADQHHKTMVALTKLWFIEASAECFDDRKRRKIWRPLVYNASKHIKEHSTDFFHPMHSRATEKCYGSDIARLLLFTCLLSGCLSPELEHRKDQLTEHGGDWLIPPGSELHGKATVFWRMVMDASPVGDDSELTPVQYQIMTDLVFHLLCRAKHVDETEVDEHVIRFLVAANTNEDYTRKSSDTITHYIAVLQRCMRVAFIVEKGRRPPSVHWFRSQVKELMHYKESYTISYLLNEQMAYVSKFAHRDPSETVQFNDLSMTSVTVMAKKGNFIVSLDSLGEAVQTAMRRLDSLMRSAFKDYQGEKTISLANLVDRADCTDDCYSFLNDASNQDLTAKLKAFMLHLEGLDENILKDDQAAKAYIHLCDDILDAMWFLLHVTSGMPYRCTTWATTRLRNGAMARRNLRLTIRNQLTLFHWYDKSRSRTKSENLCAKFVAEALVQPFLQYLVFLRPVLNILAAKYYDKLKSLDIYQDYLFVRNGKRWDHERFRSSLESQFATYLGHPLQTSKYRHVAQAFMRKKNEAPTVSQAEVFFNRQFGHSFQTGTMYGVDGSENCGIPAAFLAQHCHCSRQWQWLLKMASDEPKTWTLESLKEFAAPVAKEIHSTVKYVPMYMDPETGKRQRIEMKMVPPDEAICPTKVHTVLWNEVKQRYNQQRTQLFRSEWIQRIFYTIYCCPPQRHIVIQPTGSGKSSLFQYVSFLDKELVTVVIIVLKAPLIDQINFCQRNGIRYCEFRGDGSMQPEGGQIMFVQLERIDFAFMELFARLKHRGKLGRVFIDECDLAIRHEKFRPRFEMLKNLMDPRMSNGFVTQAVLMTATLSMEDEYALRDFFCCFDATPARCPDGLPSNICVKVTECRTESEMNERMHRHMEQLDTEAGERGIVFCLSKQEVESYARHFHDQAATYVGGLTRAEREERLLQWKEPNSRTPVMVATTAFAMGVDYPRVTRIVVMHDCYSMADFCQMAGRGGRDRSVRCEVEVLYTNSVRPRVVENTQKDKWFTDFMSNQKTCRRFPIDRFLTGYGRQCHDGEARCDRCLANLANDIFLDDDGGDISMDRSDSDAAVPASPLPLDPFASTRPHEALAREVATVQNTIRRRDDAATQHVRHHHDKWSKVCAVCYLVTGNTGEEYQHKISQCGVVKDNKLCYRCLQHHDTRRKKGQKETPRPNPCPFNIARYRQQNGHCSHCFLHRNGHQGPEMGPNCTFCVNEFVRVLPIYAFHYKRGLRNAIVQGLGVDTGSVDDFGRYMDWLFTKENDQQEMNLVRMSAYFMNNHEDLCQYLKR